MSQDGTIQEMWEKALEEFQRLVPGKTFKDLALSTTPADLRKKMEALNSEDAAKKSGKSLMSPKAKDIGLKVLAVANTLGGVAASVGEVVFGPAQICFGALSILLSIPGKAREFHELIDAVFIELDPVLSQFDMYIKMEKEHVVHDTLREAIHKVMAGFIALCASIINIQQGGRWDRFKKHASRVFAEDKDLEGDLEGFRTIVNALRDIRDTATFENTLKTRDIAIDLQRGMDGVGTNVKQIVDEQNKRKTIDKRKQWLESIRKFLGITEEDNSNPKLRQETLASSRLRNSGAWLLNHARFKDWADRHHAERDSVLFLNGAPGFGKSSLLSTVVEHLRAKSIGLGDDRRFLVSFYFVPMQKDRKAEPGTGQTLSAKDKKVYHAEMGLKWIASQLVEQDDALCKILATSLKPSPGGTGRLDEDLSFSDLWETLKIGSPSPRTTHYIIFDDVDKFSKPALQDLAKILRRVSNGDVGQCAVKVLVCGDLKPEVAEIFDDQLNDHSVMKVDTEALKDDLRRYINKALQDMLPGSECAERRQQLEEKMLDNPECSFRTIEVATKNLERVIAASGDEKDLFEALEKSTQDEGNVMKDTIQQLQDDLTSAQISLVNEILIWVMFAGYSTDEYDIQLTQIALRLRGKKPPLDGLVNFINSRCRGLLRITAADNIVLEEGARDAVIKPRDVSRRTEPSTISLEIKIINAHVPTARRFFWDLAKHATFEEFNFSANSPNAQLAETKPTIKANEVDSHLAIMEITIDLFTNTPDPDTETIGHTFLYSFAQHLRILYDAQDPDPIEDKVKVKVGKFVYNLFATPDIIERNWKLFEAKWGLLWGGAVVTYWKWLDDSVVRGALGTRDVIWLDECKKSDDKTTKLLYEVMGMIGRIWLEEAEPLPNTEWPVYWIRAYVRKSWTLQWRVPDESNSDTDSKEGSSESGDDKAQEEETTRDDQAESESKEKTEAPSAGDNTVDNEGKEESKSNGTPQAPAAEYTAEKAAPEKEPVAPEKEPVAPEKEPDSIDALLEEVTAAEITAAAEWYREKLGRSVGDLPPRWFERLGKTFAQFSMHEEAAEHFKKSVELAEPEPASWYTLTGWADSLIAQASDKDSDEEASINQKAIALKQKALEIYLDGPKGSDISMQLKLSELESTAELSETLGNPDKALEYRKKALNLVPENAEALYALLSHYIRTDRDEEIPAVLGKILATDEQTDNAPGNKPTRLVALIKVLVEKNVWSSSDLVLCRIVSAATTPEMPLTEWLDGFDEAIQNAKTSGESHLHLMFLLHKGIICLYANTTDSEITKQALDIFEEALSVADEYHSCGKTPSSRFYERIADVLGKYCFDEAKKYWAIVRDRKRSEDQETTLLLQATEKLENLVKKCQDMLNGEITAAACYRAGLLAMRGNPEAARNILKSDMVQVINMLSDDEIGNDSYAVYRLRTNLLHSGDFENAYLAMTRNTPRIGEKNPGIMRSCLEALFVRSGEPVHEGPAAQLLDLFEAEIKVGQKAPAIIQKMIDEAAKHLPSSRRKPSVEPAKTGSKTREVTTAQYTTPDNEGLAAVWSDLHKVLTQLTTQELLGNTSGTCYCNICSGAGKVPDNKWDFANNFYICKYCSGMDFCEKCFQDFRATDPSRKTPDCSLTHEWVFLPKWTPQSWAESVRMIVRPLQKNEDGDLVPGDETVALSEWLDKATGPWGGLQEGRTWDHVKASPVIKAQDENAGSEAGGDAGDGDTEKKDATDSEQNEE